MPFLSNTETIEFQQFENADPEVLKMKLDSVGMDALLVISPLDSAKKTVSAVSYASKPLGMETSESIEHKINDAVEDYRVKSYNIEGLENIMVLGMIIYMFISMFCGMVMSSVIEEKASRVVEVLVSSVKATELLFGKIIGVALVALTQFFMWIALTMLILAVVGGIAGPEFLSGAATADPTAQMAMMPGMDAASAPVPSEMSAILSTLGSIDYVQLIVVFVLFFVFGYLLYASMFAAIGSAVENEADSQQLVLPLTIPLMIGFLIAMFAYKSPDSAVVFWGSMIPFTSPMVMLTRVLFGVPTWQIVLSVSILVLTFVLCAWLSAKIYKVGILMFGKKSTFKDLWKWLKMK